MTGLLTDVRSGARLLLKSPLTTAAAILSLALGIGATTAMFSAVDAVLVRGRIREIGVRMGLGATRNDIVTLVLRQATTVVVVATAVRLGCAALLGTSIQALLFEVRPRDPWMMSTAAVVLMSTALAASYIPVRRVLAQNPLTGLRND